MRHLREMKVFILNEISVVPAALFYTIDAVMREFAELDGSFWLSFGGRKVIMAGGPLQLEPVLQRGMSFEKLDQLSSHASLAVYSKGWVPAFCMPLLTTNYRQRQDRSFSWSLAMTSEWSLRRVRHPSDQHH